MDSVYHEGELKIQEMVGETIIAQSNSRVITDTVIAGAINFIQKQVMSIVSSVEKDGSLWVSILLGDYGFTKVPEPNRLEIDRNKIHSTDKDVFYSNIEDNPTMGALFIELATRRRFRINGDVELDGDKINVRISEAYPNCPQYIQRRNVDKPEDISSSGGVESTGTELQEEHKKWISKSDTLFVGSQGPNGRLDASHRGGNKGFVEVLEDGTLKIPDYKGNSMFNTLGNFSQNPNGGVIFIDFENRRTLQLSGEVELLFNQDSAEDLSKTANTGRFWLFRTKKWIQLDNHHKADWKFVDYSPYNP